MALDLSQFTKISDLYRKRYIAEKRTSLSKIMGSYLNGIKIVGNNLATSKVPFKAKYSPIILSNAAKIIDQTSAGIARAYQSEIKTIGQVAVDSFTVAYQAAYKPLPIAFAQRYVTIPDELALEQVYKDVALAGLPLSDRIWSDQDKKKILETIRLGLAEQRSPYNIAESLVGYSLSGSGSFNAYRLAYTELTNAFNNARMQLINDWNTNPEADFKIGVEQYLSPFHRITDICDHLAGIYEGDLAPIIPRHPLCECGSRFIIMDKNNRKLAEANYNRLGSSTLDQIRANKPVKLSSKAVANQKATGAKKGSLDVGASNLNVEYGKLTGQFKGAELQAKLTEFINKIPDNNPEKANFIKSSKSLFGWQPPVTAPKSTSDLQLGNYDSSVLDNIIKNDKLKELLKERGVNVAVMDKVKIKNKDTYNGAFDYYTKTLKLKKGATDFTTYHEVGHFLDIDLGEVFNKYGAKKYVSENDIALAKTLRSENKGIIVNRVLRSKNNTVQKVEMSYKNGEFVQEFNKEIISVKNIGDYRRSNPTYYKYVNEYRELYADAHAQYFLNPDFKNYAPGMFKYFNDFYNGK